MKILGKIPAIYISIVLGILILVSSNQNNLLAQGVPQGLNYQAVARDENGYPIPLKEIVVEVTIHKDFEQGEIAWQETHSLTTNDFGMFALVIGEGQSTFVGSFLKFDAIDWSLSSFFAQVRVDFGDQAYGNGLQDMGTTKLQSVPYALLADSVLHIPKIKMRDLQDVDVTGITNGQTLKWNGTKWVVGDLMSGDYVMRDGTSDMTGDWTISQNNITLTSGTLDANALHATTMKLDKGVEINELSSDVTLGGTNASNAILPTQKAVYEYVANSSSAGQYWTLDGNYLYNLNKQVGIGVKPINYKFQASVENSYFLITGNGENSNCPSGTEPTGTASTFFLGCKGAFRTGKVNDNQWIVGNIGIYSAAFGLNNMASGAYSLAGGESCTASVEVSTAFGRYNTAFGIGSFVTGLSCQTFGIYSFAGGRKSSTGMSGSSNFAGNHSIAVGDSVTSAADACATFGKATSSTAKYALVYGNTCRVVGSSESGVETGYGSLAGGYNARAWGKNSVAIGDNTYSKSYCEVAFGRFNFSNVNGSSVTWEPSDHLFSVGNGANEPTRSNAFTVMKNGKVGIGVNMPATDAKLEVAGNIQCFALTQTSDLCYKQNIKTIESPLDKCLKMNGVTYNWKINEYKDKGFENKTQYGFIAQEVEKLFPDLVATDNNGYKSLNYIGLIPVLVEAIKEQQQIIEQLKTQNNTSQSKLEQVTNQYEALNKRLSDIETMLKMQTGSIQK